MDRHGIRYIFEHRLLPQLFFEEKFQFVGALFQKKELLFDTISNIFRDEEVENPYTVDMFGVSMFQITEETAVVKISFPEPEEEPLCYCSYLLFDKAFEKISYFCIEKGGQEDPKHPFVCAWTPDGAHRNFGICTFENYNDLMRCVDLHMKEKYGLTQKTEGDDQKR